ncbi:MAG: cobalamin B12-binding domain-containing protein [Myxococcales bacterium]|nr:cobalamin B12-binding domain-containing protein [Myxococcales bacterium]
MPTSPDAPVRFVTAASLFDGHDASINIMRRILQSRGAEVIHLGHDRSVHEIVDAAIEEDAHGIAVSSYQGGHMEYFSYMVAQLRARGRDGIKVFGGGGGTITDREIATLHDAGVTRIYSVEDGRRLGLVGMIDDMITRARRDLVEGMAAPAPGLWAREAPAVARTLTWIEAAHAAGDEKALAAFRAEAGARPKKPVLGITGVGGAGKSSLTDELVRRLVETFPDRSVAVLSVDPTRRRSGGALLGDRIRMNSASHPRVFMRSLATRSQNAAVPLAVRDALLALSAAAYDLVILETAGIGQSGSEIVDLADVSLYVMTPEFGAPSQLEKIDMLDFADVVALNKADKRGATDAKRYVQKQMQRNRGAFGAAVETMPVFACVASRYGDAGVDALFGHLMGLVDARDDGAAWDPGPLPDRAPKLGVVVPPERERYLSEVADAVRGHHAGADAQAAVAAKADGLRRALKALGDRVPGVAQSYAEAATDAALAATVDQAAARLRALYDAALGELTPANRSLLASVPALRAAYTAESHAYTVRGREIRVENYIETLSGNRIPKVALPTTDDWGDLLRWRLTENVPGEFPYTAGVFPYKRQGEDPTRMFAGEGGPERTNRRFHYLSKGQPAARLSTAFDSVTLYGRDPAERPDVYGKVGNSGVSVATLDDAKRLYSGFDLSSPRTSVSMTINGPAPMILAMFLNTAIDQAVERRLRATGRWEAAAATIRSIVGDDAPAYRGELPPGHDGAGLGLLGVSGDQLVSAEEYAAIRAEVLGVVRGTVQADILKEDQAQNTCIFSTDFALKMMGDIQQYFIDHRVMNFYSVSISGYHIAEAGANPISQLAFTLANGFTFVEYYRARGMKPDAFARNLSFFFSNGVDAEYAVIGRVARRIWAVAMREIYGAGPRSQQLKYHIQTSGRSLHAQEIAFNDIRTTLQALYAIADNCNSLHTNAYDEAITTPTEESVRRALAIQLVINRELGLTKNENPFQGAYFVEELTRIVEDAVLAEFDRLTERGGVLGAMEVMYQRSRIQDESMHYEQKKHSGELPVIGVNTFLPDHAPEGVVEVELIRATDDEKQAQIAGVAGFTARNVDRAPAALARLKQVALAGGNVFAELMETVKCCTLGQITDALFTVGGQYRRNM